MADDLEAGAAAGNEGGGSGGAEGNDLAGGTSMAAAVSTIADGLFGQKEEKDDGGKPDDGAGDGSRAPASPAPPAPAATPSPSPSPATPAAPAPAPGEQPAVDVNKAPTTWTAAAQAEYNGLSPTVKAEIHKREQDAWRGINAYQGEARFAQSIREVLKPVAQMLQGKVSPQEFVGTITGVHLSLANRQTPMAERAAIAMNLLKSYGIELGPPATLGEEGYVDPEVKDLRAKYAALESRFQQGDQQKAQQIRDSLANEINTFAADPANEFFETVAEDMVILLKGSEGRLTLKEAYDRAVYANPIARAKSIERATTSAVEKRDKEAKERAAAAKKGAAANVKTGQHQGSDTAPLGSMDETMAKTLAGIKARDK